MHDRPDLVPVRAQLAGRAVAADRAPRSRLADTDHANGAPRDVARAGRAKRGDVVGLPATGAGGCPRGPRTRNRRFTGGGVRRCAGNAERFALGGQSPPCSEAGAVSESAIQSKPRPRESATRRQPLLAVDAAGRQRCTGTRSVVARRDGAAVEVRIWRRGAGRDRIHHTLASSSSSSICASAALTSIRATAALTSIRGGGAARVGGVGAAIRVGSAGRLTDPIRGAGDLAWDRCVGSARSGRASWAAGLRSATSQAREAEDHCPIHTHLVHDGIPLS